MKEVDATYKADEFIKLMISHQPNLFGMNTAPLLDSENSKTAAQSLAVFRAELIEQLKQQP